VAKTALIPREDQGASAVEKQRGASGKLGIKAVETPAMSQSDPPQDETVGRYTRLTRASRSSPA
jgi:hypothetical protein